METTPEFIPMKWYEVWRDVILHPTIPTFNRIASSPKASVKLGVLWMAIAALVGWLIGPQRAYLWGMFVEYFGLEPQVYFYTVGAVTAVIVSLASLLLIAAIATWLARQFNGNGRYRQLVYAWGILQLPFIILAYLVMFLFSLFLSSDVFPSAKAGINALLSLIPLVGIILYLTYTEIVAFCGTEKFRFWKGFGVLILSLIILSIPVGCLSYGVQVALRSAYRY